MKTATDTKYDLRGWRAIADYMGWDRLTVRKWAKQCALPVYQVRPRGTVCARKADLDAWLLNHKFGKPE